MWTNSQLSTLTARPAEDQYPLFDKPFYNEIMRGQYLGYLGYKR